MWKPRDVVVVVLLIVIQTMASADDVNNRTCSMVSIKRSNITYG